MRQTLDLDFSDIEKINRIIEKLIRSGATSVEIRLSSSMNGYHVVFQSKDDIDRLVFDDQRRYSADLLDRRPESRNVLFREKSYKKGNGEIRLTAGEWVKIV